MDRLASLRIGLDVRISAHKWRNQKIRSDRCVRCSKKGTENFLARGNVESAGAMPVVLMVLVSEDPMICVIQAFDLKLARSGWQLWA